MDSRAFTNQRRLRTELTLEGGDLRAKVGQLSPGDFRLAKGSPGQGAGPGGKDLGADVDRVGPGAAYERWKKTPEFQEWRKKADDLMAGIVGADVQ